MTTIASIEVPYILRVMSDGTVFHESLHGSWREAQQAAGHIVVPMGAVLHFEPADLPTLPDPTGHPAAAGLRELADFIDANPSAIQTPTIDIGANSTYYDVENTDEAKREWVTAMARLLDVEVTQPYGDGSWHALRRFGPVELHLYELSNARLARP